MGDTRNLKDIAIYLISIENNIIISLKYLFLWKVIIWSFPSKRLQYNYNFCYIILYSKYVSMNTCSSDRIK